jgi:hypothetical protein
VSLLTQRLGELVGPILIGGCWGGRGFHGRQKSVAELSCATAASGPWATGKASVQAR